VIKTIVWTILRLLPLVTELWAENAEAANFNITTDPGKTCSAIAVEGEIQLGDYDRFMAALKEAIATAPLRRLYLNSGGGNVGTALAMTDAIRNVAPDIETIVQARQSCNSACVIILTVGSRHNVSADAHVNIHQVFEEKTGKRDAKLTSEIGRYLALNGLPPDVMWTMGNLKPDELLAISSSNAVRLGFGSLNFYGSTNPPATPRCSWEGFAMKKP
jgi:hypothetical protein